jgi:hypothetical protein
MQDSQRIREWRRERIKVGRTVDRDEIYNGQ